MIAVALGDLLGGTPEQDHGVGGPEAAFGAEGELDLAGTELDFKRSQGKAEGHDVAAQDLEDRVHLVVTLLGQVLITLVEQRDLGWLAGLAGLSGIAGAEARLLDLEEMEFDFEAGEEAVARLAELRQCLLADMARAEWHRAAVGEDDVAQHPARVRCPRQHTERGGIRQHHHVGRTFPLLGAEGSAGAPDREHRSMGGVLQQHRRGEAQTAGDGRGDFAGRQRLAAQDAVLVGEGEADDGEPVGLEAALDLARGGLAVVGPQTGLLGEMHRGQATSGGRVWAAQLEPLRRRASNSFQ